MRNAARFAIGKKTTGIRRIRGTLDFAAMDDRRRLPWRFLARHIAVDGLAARA